MDGRCGLRRAGAWMAIDQDPLIQRLVLLTFANPLRGPPHRSGGDLRGDW